MKRFAGLDVSLSTTSICVVDGQGHIVFEGVVPTDPDAIGAVLAPQGPDLVGLEAGPMSEWLHAGLSRHGLETVLMETRHVHAALKASLIETDRRDAYGIAQLLRMGWFRPVHVKAASARERRVLLGARDTLVRRLRDLDNSVRGFAAWLGSPTAAPAAGALERSRSPADRRTSGARGGDRPDPGRPRPPQRGARPPRQAGPGSGAR
jgi:transposase